MYKNQIYSTPPPPYWIVLIRFIIGIPLTIGYTASIGKAISGILWMVFDGVTPWIKWVQLPFMIWFAQQSSMLNLLFFLVMFTPENTEELKFLVEIIFKIATDFKHTWALWLYFGGWTAFGLYRWFSRARM